MWELQTTWQIVEIQSGSYEPERFQMKRTLGERLKLRWGATLGGALLFAGSLLGFAVLPRTQNAASAATFQLEASPQTGIQHEGKILTSFAPLVKLAAPSVVKISVTVQAKQMSSQIPDMPDEFRRFFGGRDNGTDSSRQHSAPKQHEQSIHCNQRGDDLSSHHGSEENGTFSCD